jgi:hypothetical protein
VQISVDGQGSVPKGRVIVFSANGAHVRSLRLDASGRTTWDLCDDSGRPVAAGVYFVHRESVAGASGSQRVVVVR